MDIILQIKDFWVVTPCSVAVGYQCFRGPHSLLLQHHTVSQPKTP